MASDIERREVKRLSRSGGGWSPGDLDLGLLLRPGRLLWDLLGRASRISSLSLLWPESRTFCFFFSGVALCSFGEAPAEQACRWETCPIDSHGPPFPGSHNVPSVNPTSLLLLPRPLSSRMRWCYAHLGPFNAPWIPESPNGFSHWTPPFVPTHWIGSLLSSLYTSGPKSKILPVVSQVPTLELSFLFQEISGLEPRSESVNQVRVWVTACTRHAGNLAYPGHTRSQDPNQSSCPSCTSYSPGCARPGCQSSPTSLPGETDLLHMPCPSSPEKWNLTWQSSAAVSVLCLAFLRILLLICLGLWPWRKRGIEMTVLPRGTQKPLVDP